MPNDPTPDAVHRPAPGTSGAPAPGAAAPQRSARPTTANEGAAGGEGAAAEATPGELAPERRPPTPAFHRNAEAYVHSAIHARGADLDRVVAWADAALGGLAGRTALDVATGGGHTARVLARAGARVTALDPSLAMLAAARAHLDEAVAGGGVRFVRGRAESLPLAAGSVELVTCRIAAHHFDDPRRFLAEAWRVLAPGGALVVVDNIAPASPRHAEVMNAVERGRDPGHVRAYDVGRWVGWVSAAGFEVHGLERFWRSKDAEAWFERAGAGPEGRAAALTALAGAEPEVRAYLVEEDAADGTPRRLRHEVMALLALRPAWS